MIELWILFILVATVLSAVTAIIEKKVLIKEHAMEFIAVFGLLFFLVATPLFFRVDYGALEWQALCIIGVATLFSVSGAIFVSKAMRHTDVGTVMSLWVLGPGITALFAFIALGEGLGILQLSGIGLLIIGSYLLESHEHQKVLDPFKKLIQKKYLRYVLIALVIYSVSAVLDRTVLSRFEMQIEAFVVFSALFYMLFSFIALSLFHNGVKGIAHGVKNAGWWILLVSFLSLFITLFQAKAISLAPVALVLSIKRLATLLVIVLGGGIFHEKRIVRKLISAGIMIVGVFLVIG